MILSFDVPHLERLTDDEREWLIAHLRGEAKLAALLVLFNRVSGDDLDRRPDITGPT